jgi:hypothetical protein
MQQRVRLALQTGSFDKMATDGSTIVEADETFIGGKARNKFSISRRRKSPYGSGSVGKQAVMGLLERHSEKQPSKVRTFVVDDTKKQTLQPIVHQHVQPGAQICTDENLSYAELGTTFAHAVINHAEKYVDGNVHTNGLENFWSLFKRCIKGTHVSVEPFHLFRYLDSECFRFNNRKLNDSERFRLALNGVTGKRLTYKSLIGTSLEERTVADDISADDLPN